MNKDLWEELVAQVEDHGPECIKFELQTDSGNGQVIPNDVKFEDGVILVTMD